MNVYNKDKTKILSEYDLAKGYLKDDTITIHIEAVEGREEQGHYETIAEYHNGGKDVEWIVDVEGIEPVEEHDESEDIQVYIPYTEEELKRRDINTKINDYKQKLADTDYEAIKYAEGWFTDEEYKEMREKRAGYRLEINKLQDEIEKMSK